MIKRMSNHTKSHWLRGVVIWGRSVRRAFSISLILYLRHPWALTVYLIGFCVWLAPSISLPVAHLFNLSVSKSQVPIQWKSSIITPVPKVAKPKSCSDFRPISVTPILSRLLEKILIRGFIYPALQEPSCKALFNDQFAFRPTGSCTSALIHLTHQAATLLQEYPYVHLISLDYSKAFDTCRHSTFSVKLSDLPIPAKIHNWLVDYLTGRQHCTKYKGSISIMLVINSSFVQGSGIGPVAFIIQASDLHPKHPGNYLDKYADDMYLLVPSVNSQLIPEELRYIAEWAAANNLSLNEKKTAEMVLHKKRDKRFCSSTALARHHKGWIYGHLGSHSQWHPDFWWACVQNCFSVFPVSLCSPCVTSSWTGGSCSMGCHTCDACVKDVVCFPSLVGKHHSSS